MPRLALALATGLTLVFPRNFGFNFPLQHAQPRSLCTIRFAPRCSQSGSPVTDFHFLVLDLNSNPNLNLERIFLVGSFSFSFLRELLFLFSSGAISASHSLNPIEVLLDRDPDDTGSQKKKKKKKLRQSNDSVIPPGPESSPCTSLSRQIRSRLVPLHTYLTPIT